jgi:AhpC/TSA family
VRVLAISADEPHDSKLFAMMMRIWFPLLSDGDLAVSRVYAGETSDANALPGVTVIDRSGRIVFRQVASAKDDRISTQDLLAAIDDSLGTHGPDATGRGFAAIERAQIRLDAGGGIVAGGAGPGTIVHTSGTGVASLAALFPISRYLLVGPCVGFEPRDAPLDTELELIARLPIWHATGAIELAVDGGYATLDDRGATGAARAGLWFAISPTWSVQLDAGASVHEHGTVGAFATLGIARLFRIH